MRTPRQIKKEITNIIKKVSGENVEIKINVKRPSRMNSYSTMMDIKVNGKIIYSSSVGTIKGEYCYNEDYKKYTDDFRRCNISFQDYYNR